MGHAARLAKHRDDYIGLPSHRQGLLEHRCGRAWIDVDVFVRKKHQGRWIVNDVGPFGIAQSTLARLSLMHAGAKRDHLLGSAIGIPTAKHVCRVIGQWADQGDVHAFMQRQRAVSVFQQHQGAARHIPRLGTMLSDLLASGVGTQALIRGIKQAQFVLGCEHLANRAVQLGFADLSLLDQASQLVTVMTVAHAHLCASGQRCLGRLGAITGHAMVYQLCHCAVVADD